MKTNRNFAELLGLVAASISIIGIIAVIASTMINLFVFKGTNQTLNSIGITGALAFMMPFFLLQFAMPSGLLNYFGIQTDVPIWGKAMFYLIVFPFVNMWMLSAADAAFHFLPNFHEAMAQGIDRITVQTMHQEIMSQAWTIIGVMYVSMIGTGLLFKGLFYKKLKAKIA